MSKQNVDDFCMVTSASEAKARNYLLRYNQDLERAIQAWYRPNLALGLNFRFEAGENPDDVPQQPAPQPQPVVQPVVQQAEKPPVLTFIERKRRVV